MVKGDDATPRLFALVPCSGIGERSGAAGPKQYADVAGLPMVAHTLHALGQVRPLHATLVVLAGDDRRFELSVPGFTGWLERCGGASRAVSVANGLDALSRRGARDHDWVLVHDAARCLLRAEWVQRLIDACADDPVGGLLALPLADTLKSARDGRVAATLERTDKWAAQTPQMFRLGLLREALRVAGPSVTDEAGAIEALGHAPLLVRGEAENFKLTWPADFDLASRLLRTREDVDQLRRAERRATPKPSPANRETRLALRPSLPAQAGMEPRPSLPSGDRPMHPSDEGLT